MGSTVVLAALLCSGGADVVARVDGTPITRATFIARADAAGPQVMRLTAERFLDGLIDEVLLAAEARRRGLDRSPAAIARVDGELRRAAGDAFVDKEITGRIEPDEQTLLKLFHSTADSASYESLTYENAEKAAAALERIARGSTFEAEAKGAVVSRVYAAGAKPPLVMRGEIDAGLAGPLFDAAPGKAFGPVQLSEGAAIARLVAKQIGTQQAFAERRPALAAYARKQLAAEMRKHVVAQLRARSGVTLDEAFLRSLDGGEPTPEQLGHVLATIDGRPLRYADIRDGLRAIGAAAGHMGAAVKVRYAWQQVDERLVQSVAVERGFLNAPEVVARRPELERSALAEAMVQNIVASAPPPTEDEIEAFYRRNERRFGKPFAKALPEAAAGAAQEKAQAALAETLARLRKKASISIDRDALARAARREA